MFIQVRALAYQKEHFSLKPAGLSSCLHLESKDIYHSEAQFNRNCTRNKDKKEYTKSEKQ